MAQVKKLFAFLLILLAFFLFSAASFQRQETGRNFMLEELAKEQQWVDSLYNAMSGDERLGQLMWIRAHSDKGPDHVEAVENLIKKYHVGGLCFFQGTPEKQTELTNHYQTLAKRVPLFVSIDAEWGLGMRMKETAMCFPRQLMLGAIQDDRLIYQMGAEIARQCKRIGVNVNFAPVADVNSNPANPVIGSRSFGEDPYKVAAKAYMYMKGMQDNGVLACAKHFPGHGDTDVDSHFDLPVISHSMQRLDSVELFPFKILIEQGIGSIMVAHLQVPAIDSTKNLPTTLSKPAVTDLLKNRLGFNGLVMTDALEMKGVTKYYDKGEVEAKALAAGNDVLLLPGDVDAAFRTIKDWLKKGRLDPTHIENSVKKNLRWKYRLGLTVYEPVELAGIRKDVNDNQARAVKRQLIESALTLVRNEGELLPFQRIDTLNLAALAIGDKTGNAFHQTLSRYANIETSVTDKEISIAERQKLISKLKGKDAVIVSLHDMSQFPGKAFGITESAKAFIEALNKQTRVVLVVFGNAYALKYFDGVEHVLEAYEEDAETEDLAAQALFGAFSIRGKLPVTASEVSKAGDGIVTQSLQRLGYGLPEEVGMSSEKLHLADLLMQESIDSGAMPGGVVLVAKDGKVVFEKACGRHTYDANARPTQPTDIFDLASLTKVAATTVSLMKLQEEGKFNVQDPVEKYLPEFAATNKAGIPVIEMMTHRAGLTPWIKFYQKTVKKVNGASKNLEFPDAKPLPEFYQSRKSAGFPIPVAQSLWLRADYPDTIWREIRDSPLLPTKDYKYSDLGFYIAGEIVHRLSGEPLDVYVGEQFYQSLGMTTTTFRPLEKFPIERIPPTEEDSYFRARRIQGYVHDMGAAMLNQVAGHAGLFSNANDLAKLMQMLLNKGYYGGRQLLKPETVHFYTTRCVNCTRRGIGFDMPQLNTNFQPNLSTLASQETFGHLGFTGTAVWADPKQHLIFVFLSNRTYPSMHNNKLGTMNTRVKVMDAVYGAIEE